MSATERLVVCYTGANEHTGAVRPPAVPLGELLDTLDRTASGDVRERVLTRHPLQAYDTANLTAEGVGRGRPFSFDPAALAGARSAVGERTPRAPFLPGPLPPREPEDVSLDDLHRFLAHPVRHFCRERLGIGTPLEAPEDKDAMPVELDSLEAWAIGDRLLADLVAGVDMEQAFLAEQLRGSLPPQSLGVGALTGAVTQVQQLWNSSASLREGEPRAVDVIVDLGDGRRVTGTVSGVHGHRAVRMGYSRVGAKQRLASWLDLLALSAAHPDQHWAAVTIGRARGKAVCAVSGPLDHRARRLAARARDAARRRAHPPPPAAGEDVARLPGRRELRSRRAARGGRQGVGDRPQQLLRHRGRGRRSVAHPGPWRAGAARGPDRRRAAGLRRAAVGTAAGRGAEGEATVSIDPAPFRIHDPLPTGTTLLEASAGTGKTWTIGALVARYVGEGVARLEEMLVVTFGRAASQELRERVRAQLVEAEAALADPAAYDGDNAVVRLLLDVGELGDAELDVRHGRLVEALAGFDGATIATTHQFCSMVLDSLGVAGDTDAGARLVEDLDDLVDEVVDDLYLRKFAPGAGPPAFTRKVAVGIARAVVGDPRARLLPEGEDPASGPGVRFAFAQAVREEMERRKRRLGILSYDDLLSRLADALERDDSPARSRMRQRWRIVLVDEFQDTDPVQWEVLDRAFSGHATMVLIGDPKQAIYAFRGGDVFAYLDAARTAVSRRTLDTNWRSDAPAGRGARPAPRGCGPRRRRHRRPSGGRADAARQAGRGPLVRARAAAGAAALAAQRDGVEPADGEARPAAHRGRPGPRRARAARCGSHVGRAGAEGQ